MEDSYWVKRATYETRNGSPFWSVGNFTPAYRKRKRRGGPTIEAAQYGLAEPGQETYKPEITEPVPRLDELAPGTMVAQGIASLAPRAEKMTRHELQVRNINLAHFKATGRLATPDFVMRTLSEPMTGDLTYDEYLQMFSGADELVKWMDDYEMKTAWADPANHPRIGVPHKAEPNTPYFHERPKETDIVLAGGIGKGSYSGRADQPRTIRTVSGDNPSAELAADDMREIVTYLTNPRESTVSLAHDTDPAADTKNLSVVIAGRLRAVGAPVEWDVENPQNDPDFLRYVVTYAMGQQLAYSLWGNEKDQAVANERIAYLRSVPLEKDQLADIGRKMGIGTAEWTDQNTYALLVDAMQVTDDEAMREVVWQSWYFGRPANEHMSVTLAKFVGKFGDDRLPAEQREMYLSDPLASPKGFVGAGMMLPGRAWHWVETSPHVPYHLREAAKVPGGIAHGGMQFMGVAIGKPMQAISTLADVAVQGEPLLYEKHMDSAAYSEYLSSGGKAPSHWERFGPHLEDYHWDVWTDIDRWRGAWSDAGEANPFETSANQLSLEELGRVDPIISGVGQIADVALMFYLGAKIDPALRATARVGSDAVFIGGRWVEARTFGPALVERAARRKAAQRAAIEEPALLRETGVPEEGLAPEAGVGEVAGRTVETVEAPPKMFETEEFIGEGKQASLDIAVDETARKTEPFAPPPAKGEAPMPGQTGIETPKPKKLRSYQDVRILREDGETYVATIVKDGVGKDTYTVATAAKNEIQVVPADRVFAANDVEGMRAAKNRLGVKPEEVGPPTYEDLVMRRNQLREEAEELASEFDMAVPVAESESLLHSWTGQFMAEPPPYKTNIPVEEQAIWHYIRSSGGIRTKSWDALSGKHIYSQPIEKGMTIAERRSALAGLENNRLAGKSAKAFEGKQGQSFDVMADDVKRSMENGTLPRDSRFFDESMNPTDALAEFLRDYGATGERTSKRAAEAARKEAQDQLDSLMAELDAAEAELQKANEARSVEINGKKITEAEVKELQSRVEDMSDGLLPDQSAKALIQELRVRLGIHEEITEAVSWLNYHRLISTNNYSLLSEVEARMVVDRLRTQETVAIKANDIHMKVNSTYRAHVEGEVVPSIVREAEPGTVERRAEVKAGDRVVAYGEGVPVDGVVTKLTDEKVTIKPEKGKAVSYPRADVRRYPETVAELRTLSERKFPEGSRVRFTDRSPAGEQFQNTGEVIGRDEMGNLSVKTPEEEVAGVNPMSAELVSADGVRVTPVEIAGEAVPVDASVAPEVRHLNQEGYPTVQSHGRKGDHPEGHPTLIERTEPYVEFKFVDLGTTQATRANKAGKIGKAAEKSGMKTGRGKAPDGHSTIIVGGENIGAFVNELLGAKKPPSRPVLAAPSTDPTVPIRNVIFRTSAEIATAIDDPYLIAKVFEIPETRGDLKAIARRLAKSEDVTVNELLLRELNRQEGITIDGGANMLIRNARQAAYRRGMGKKNWMRFFITPTLYDRTQPVRGSTDAVHNFMVATKLGYEKMTPEVWAKVRSYTRRMWEEDRVLEKRNIVKEIEEEIKGQIIERDGSLAKYEAFKRRFYWCHGRAMLSGQTVAYLGGRKEGQAVEKSRAVVKKKARAEAQEQIDAAKADLEAVLADSKATPKERAAFERAVAEAEERSLRIADAIDTVERIGVEKQLSLADEKALAEAHRILDNYSVPVPFKLGQRAAHIEFSENPRVLSMYLAGKTSQSLALVDAAVFSPLITTFKETVMSSLGFPLKVNLGDEYIRLISEGTIMRLRQARRTRKEAKSTGLWGDEISTELLDRMAYDWAGSETGSWILVSKGTHPRYFEYLAEDLKSWSREPIVRRLVAENDGVFPEKPGDIRTFIRKAMDEDSELNAEIRSFLEDTYRIEGSTIDTAAFNEWCALWQDRMEAIGQYRDLRQAMTSRPDITALKRLPDEALWPVNAPEQALTGFRGNPLAQLPRANPYHYVYNGVRVPFSHGRRVGSLQLLGGLSNWLRETVFADRYYLELKAEYARSPSLKKTSEGRMKAHELAADRAMHHTNKVTYSRSATMFEDMTRNLIPFGNAYRQFWVYWGATFLKHPVVMSTFMETYDRILEDQFVGLGDYQAFLPAVPFFAATDPGAPEGLKGTLYSNVPQASFLVTGGARTLMGGLGMDPAEYANYPGMAGLDTSMAPFSRQARLLYGLTGTTALGSTDELKTLFGDPAKLEKATINAIVAQMRYDDDGSGHGKVTRDKPIWWSANQLLGEIVGFPLRKLGMGKEVHPEALFAEEAKAAPIPATVSYSPEVTRNRSQWMYDYFQRKSKGDDRGAAVLRVDHPWLNRYLAYYDATAEEQVAMKLDPKNTDMLKFWVSPYNYDDQGRPYDGTDWQEQFTSGRVSYKSEAEYEAAIHNLYVDIHGGTYVTQTIKGNLVRQGGTQYAGDAPRAEARKRTIAKIKSATKWARGIARYAAKTNGWDYDQLMWQFQNAGPNWVNGGMWPQIIRANGLDPAQYHVQTIASVYFDTYGGDYTPSDDTEPLEAVQKSTYGKVKPETLSTEDALKALEMSEYLPTKELAEKFLSSTPYLDTITQTKAQRRTETVKAVIQSAGAKQWYFIGSQQLRLVGIPASPKIDLIQNELRSDYEALKKLDVGSDSYKAARTAYWAKRDRLLGSVKGGRVLCGGLAERLIAIPWVLRPRVTSMGTGTRAVEKEGRYQTFMATVDRELRKTTPDQNVIGRAWEKVSWKGYQGKQREELLRVAAWSFLLAEAKRRRADMRSHYSDYYEAKGESVASKYGTAHVKALNGIIVKLRRFSPRFASESDDWFGSDANLGYRLLDWYDY